MVKLENIHGGHKFAQWWERKKRTNLTSAKINDSTVFYPNNIHQNQDLSLVCCIDSCDEDLPVIDLSYMHFKAMPEDKHS